MNFLLGLTGSIGMGKSTTAKMFVEAGAALWDADAVVHKLYLPDGAGTAALREVFPDAVDETGVQRDKLSRAISNDPDLLPKIEALIHPLVAQDRADFIDKKSRPVLVFDIPLLFETGAVTQFDAVAVASTSADLQRERVLARPGMTEAKLEFILSKQMPDAEKRALADFVIDTTSLESAQADVARVMSFAKAQTPNA